MLEKPDIPDEKIIACLQKEYGLLLTRLAFLQLAEFLRPQREMILELIGRAEQLAQVLASRSPEWALCHSDIHPENLFIDSQSTLFIVVGLTRCLHPRSAT